MLFKIRTKLITAFLGIIFPFLFIVGVISIYNLSIIYKGIHKIEATTEQRGRVTDLRFAIEGALMPGNDYIITGDRKYIEEFQKESKVVEDRIKHVEEILAHPAGIYQASEKMEMLKDTKNAWQNIKGFSLKIFEIPDIIGNRDASRLMEEMDYKWGYPAIERLRQWREIDLEENREAHEMSEKAWRQASIIMVAGSIILVALGVSFALFYSKIFVKPIEAIHNGADAIAGGDFKTRLDIKTGDELEQLSNAMNEMAEKLDDFYGSLEDQVKERTKELRESEADLKTLVEHSPIAMIVDVGVDVDEKIMMMNQKFTELFGYTLEDVPDVRHWWPLAYPDEQYRKALKAEWTGMVEKAIQSHGDIEPMETTVTCKDGIIRQVRISFASIGSKNIVTFEDFTERKLAETKLVEQLDELRRWHDVLSGRERRILVLKHEINELLVQAGQPPRYPSAESDD